MAIPAPLPQGAHLRALTAARRHEEARAAARALVERGEADREIMYLYALNLRCLGRLTEALAFLDEFERAHADFSRIHQERGHCRIAQGDAAAAIASFESAIRMNSALRDSFMQLTALYAAAGQEPHARDAARHAEHLASLPPDLVRAASLLADGDLERSEALLRSSLASAPSAQVLHFLGRVRHARGAWLDAQCFYEQALNEAPDLVPLQVDYVRLLLDRQKYGAALLQLEQLTTAALTSGQKMMFAAAFLGLGRAGEAIETLHDLLAITADGDLWLALGDALRAVGRRDESVEAYRHAARSGTYATACWSLANLKDHRFLEPEVSNMRTDLARTANAEAREALCFAIGSAFKDGRDYAGSWRAFEQGNALHRARHPYDAGRGEAVVRQLIDTCDARFFNSRSGWGVSEGDAIFIIGLPRSGSTLVEQILASHSAVEATRELGELPALVHDLEGRRPELASGRYPAIMADLAAHDATRLGHEYLESTRPYRATASRFIDKLPNNFFHVGLIHLMMPHATIIDVRREPMDCCLSNFQQRYARGQEFSYDLTDLGHYYRLYLRLLRHWHDVLPGRVLTMHYEDLVGDLEGQVRRLLTHCGLPYEKRCLQFHETQRLVMTPSSEQVRRPLSRQGIGASQPYREWLGPLVAVLGNALEDYRD